MGVLPMAEFARSHVLHVSRIVSLKRQQGFPRYEKSGDHVGLLMSCWSMERLLFVRDLHEHILHGSLAASPAVSCYLVQKPFHMMKVVVGGFDTSKLQFVTRGL